MSSNIQTMTMVISKKVLEPRLVKLGPVVLKCYISNPNEEKVEERTSIVKDDIFSSITKEVIRAKKELIKTAKPNSLILIEFTGKGFVYKHAFYKQFLKMEEDIGEELIFPSPSKLIKIGILVKDRITWYTPKRGEELYVYEGRIDAPEEVEFVIIETESGSKTVYTSKRLQRERS